MTRLLAITADLGIADALADGPRPVEEPEGRLAGGGELAERTVPDTAEEMREVMPPRSAAQALGRLGVSVDTGCDLGKDAVARECAEDAMQGVSIRPGLSSELLHGTRPVSQGVRDPQVSGDREQPRHERSPEELPEV